MQKAQKARLTEGPIGKQLVTMSIPMFIGMMGMIAFNLIDTYFIGQLGRDQLAAISFTFPVVMVIGSLAMGLGIGASSLVSKAIGQGNFDRVRRLTTDGLFLALVVVAFAVGVGLLTIDPLFTALGANERILGFIREYMIIWYPGVLFVVVPMVGNSIIRATGDTKTPGLIMLVVVFFNGILDPLLIFGIGPFPQLGMAGAALATVISRAITLIVAVWVLAYREKMITLEFPGFTTVMQSWKQILSIGLPSGATNAIIPVSIGVVTRLVASYGPSAVAGFGVASRIDIFVLSVTISVSAVLAPFTGQNWGAGQKDRVVLAAKYCIRFSMVWGITMFVILQIISKPVAAIFNPNPEVIQATATYLSIVPLSYAFQGILNLVNSTLNALQKPLYAAGLTILQMVVLLIPLAFAGSWVFGILGIFWAIVVANTTAGIIAYLVLRWTLERIEWKIPVVAVERQYA